jgi:hypothetical protein
MRRIQRDMDNGGRVEIVIRTSYKDIDNPKRVINYRVYANGSDQFIEGTRFQVRKFFNESQRANDDLYHEIKKDIDGDSKVCYGHRLGRIAKRKQKAAVDIRYTTMLACMALDAGTVYL